MGTMTAFVLAWAVCVLIGTNAYLRKERHILRARLISRDTLIDQLKREKSTLEHECETLLKQKTLTPQPVRTDTPIIKAKSSGDIRRAFDRENAKYEAEENHG